MRLFTHTGNFNKNGITLIALVVTIVILLILAGVSLNLVFRNNGIVTKANLAVVKQENATVAEAMQFKVNYYNMESIEDIKTALQNDGIMDANGIVDTYTLLEQKLKTGNGSNNKDVYVIEDGRLYYYEKSGEKVDMGDLWNLKIADLEETDQSLFEVNDDGWLILKDYSDYYSPWSTSPKTWTQENLVIPKTVNGKEVKVLYFAGSSTPRGWENIKTIFIPESVTQILYDSAFAWCSGLTNIIVDENNTVYDSRDNCNAIIKKDTNTLIAGCKNTIIPSSVTAIGDYAFTGCTGMTSITINENIKHIGTYTFAGSGLTSINVNEKNTVYDSRDNCNAIIEKDTNKLVTGCKNTIIPSSVTAIGDHAFSNCTGLINITLPENLTYIGNSAFARCTGLSNIVLPNNISFGGYTFADCTGLTSITFPENLDMGNNLFCGCTGLTSITIPDSVTSIGNGTFYGCSNLTNIVIPNNINIGNGAFSRCTGLTSLIIPENAYIGSGAFSDCTGLTNITIPNTITSIGGSAFSGCTGLTNITIPDSVTSIGGSAFEGCFNLTNIVIPSGVTCIENGTFEDCTKLTNIIIPNSVTRIGNFAFYECTGLTNITIPNNVTSIGSYAFYECTGLTNITIPNNVTSIGSYAFSRCLKLTNITIPNSVVNMEWNVFSEWKSNQTINCEATEKPDGWNKSWNYGCNAKINWNAK